VESLPPLKKYIWGIVKRFYWLLPSLLSDPFDIPERWFNIVYTTPSYLVWVLIGIGLFIASFLTYRELYVESAKKDVPTATLQRRTHLNLSHQKALLNIVGHMERIHGHSDRFGLEADMLDGILVSDLMKRPCSRCGKLRNQRGDII